MIGCSTFLELAQGFGLVTPDPFSSRELGAVWARDYLSSSPSYINIAQLLMFHLLYSLVFSVPSSTVPSSLLNFLFWPY